MSVELNTRISLRYDSFSEWTSKNPELLAGEVAIVALTNVNSTTGGTSAGTEGQHPVLMKVGPGNFNNLPWMSALAADVHEWAKKATPDWTDFPALPINVVDNETGKFVIDFEYANNTLTIHRGDVAWADVTGKPEFDNLYKHLQEAKSYAGSTIKTVTGVTQDAQGVVTVTYEDIVFPEFPEDKDTVTTVAQGSGIVVVSDNAEDPTYTVSHANTSDVTNLAAADRTYVKALSFDDFGHVIGYETGVEENIPEYSIVKDSASNSEYAAVYHLTKDGTNIGEAINIPKDMVVESGSVETNPEGQPEGTYIKLVLANANEDELFIPVDSLIEYVTGDTANDGMITVAVDPTTHVVTATINNGTITKAKLDSSVQGSLDKADNSLNEAAVDARIEAVLAGADSTVTVQNAVNAQNAETAANLGEHAANEYVLKTEASGYDDILTTAVAATTYQPIGDYLTEITTTDGNGLKVTNKNKVDIDTSVVFVFNCGNASTTY